MAEIEIERRPRRNGWTWFALVLVLVGIAIGAWLIFGDGIGTATDTAPAAEIETTIEQPLNEPAGQAPSQPAGPVERR